MHKALGRGLESLLPMSARKKEAQGTVNNIPVKKIRPNKYQPRTEFNKDKINELANSIKNHGLAQPLLVCPSAIPGEYELIAGERRLRACKVAGITEVPAVVRNATEKEKFQLSLIENIQRENLNPIEEAHAFKHLSDEFKLTQEALSDVVGKNRSVIANAIRLLNLPEEIQEAVSSGVISPGHGRILAGIDDKSKLKTLAERILREKLTVRETERIASDWKSVIKGVKKKAKKQDAEIIKLSEDLQHRLGTKIKVKGNAKKGKIVIYYYSLKELDRISSLLKSKKHK